MSSSEPRLHEDIAITPLQPLEQQLRLQKSQEELLNWLQTLESEEKPHTKDKTSASNLYQYIR